MKTVALLCCSILLYSSAHANEKKKLNELKPEARKVFVKFLHEARKTFFKHTIVVAETYRTQARQNELYKKGRTKTNVKVSMHTKRLAADIYFIRRGKISKYDDAPYLQLGEIGESFGLIWGGRWKVPWDPGHYELKEVIR
jgi:peptidoglycan L-alanyl-D-glutamate endopeptidase CwlK